MSAYRSVVPHRHTRDGAQRWAARVRGRWLGTFETQEVAASVVAKHLGVSRRSLKRTDDFSGNFARRVFRCAYKVFRGYVPGDLKHTRLQEVQCRKEFDKDLPHLQLVLFFLWLVAFRPLLGLGVRELKSSFIR